MEEQSAESIPIPKELWDTVPPAAQAALLVVFNRLQTRIRQLEARVADLEARLAKYEGGQGGSGAAAGEKPQGKPAPPKPKTGKKRGGQQGHQRHLRPLVPPEKLKQAHDHRPESCTHCGGRLAGDDPEPLRHQVAEIPPLQPEVTEHRLHRLCCEQCGHWTRAELPAGVPRGQFGPRLTAMLAMLRGAYRMGVRPVQSLCDDFFGLSISTGAICDLSQATSAVLEKPYQQVAEQIRQQSANIDETPWRENRRRAVLWTVVTATVTVFRIAATKGANVLR